MKNISLTLILLTLCTSMSFAANKQYVYNQIAQSKGLTATVNCIYKEKDGEVWVGTPTGLYSFNG